MKTTLLIPIWSIILLLSGCKPTKIELPNILWITSEDNSPMLGCYGDSFATTPHLDQMASEGFRYTNAYANTPVCAPARNTILTGVHACSNGNEQMRSNYPKSDLVRPYTECLHQKGYYCTNNSKTDYNFADINLDDMWDECGKEAHFKNRAKGQPFFAIFNITTSHESSIHKSVPDSLLRHNPMEVPLPPYHPDTPEMRHDWAQYYDKVEDLDRQVGELLKELEEAGLAENTIVFYYSDHGGILGRSKRYLFETGTHVPMIIRIPEKYKAFYPEQKPGEDVDRLVSFVDLAPTLLSLVGTSAPEYMQGDAFLGKHQQEEPDHIYMFRDRMDGRYDLSRSIVDGTYRYTRNFNSNRIYMQHLEYLWRAPSMVSWENAFLAGKCNKTQSLFWKTKPVEELYNTDSDPWEVNNLAGDPGHAELLEGMRKAMKEKSRSIRDAGFIPEADRIIRTRDQTTYDYMRSGAAPFMEIESAAFLASEADPDNMKQLLELMAHEDGAVRYWASHGILLLREVAIPHLETILKAASDPSWNVCVAAAETLFLLGQEKEAVAAYRRVLNCPEPMARVHALNSIESIGGSPELFLKPCLEVLGNYDVLERQYDARVIKWLLEKWDVDPVEHGIEFPW